MRRLNAEAERLRSPALATLVAEDFIVGGSPRNVLSDGYGSFICGRQVRESPQPETVSNGG
jgi:hypothetical protein